LTPKPDPDLQQREALLKTVLRNYFASDNAGILRIIQSEAGYVDLASGSTLLCQGDVSDDVYFVLSGRLRAFSETESGVRKILSEIGRGDTIGELALFTGEPRSATIVALTDAVLYEITREHVAALLAERAAIAEAISVVVARRRVNAASRLAAAGAAPDQEVRNFSDQVLQKMRFFFRHVMERHQAAQGGRG
jgi:NTE family protein